MYYAGLTKGKGPYQPSDDEDDEQEQQKTALNVYKSSLSRFDTYANALSAMNDSDNKPISSSLPPKDLDWNVPDEERLNTVGMRARSADEAQLPYDPPGRYYSHSKQDEGFLTKSMGRIIAACFGIGLGLLGFIYLPSAIASTIGGMFHGSSHQPVATTKTPAPTPSGNGIIIIHPKKKADPSPSPTPAGVVTQTSPSPTPQQSSPAVTTPTAMSCVNGTLDEVSYCEWYVTVAPQVSTISVAITEQGGGSYTAFVTTVSGTQITSGTAAGGNLVLTVPQTEIPTNASGQGEFEVVVKGNAALTPTFSIQATRG